MKCTIATCYSGDWASKSLMGLHPRNGKIPHPLTYIFQYIGCPFLRGAGREAESGRGRKRGSDRKMIE